METSAEESSKAIVFFDGECNLCNGFIDFLMRQDSNRRLYVASLQGETASHQLPSAQRTNLSSVVFLTPSGKIYQESEAIIRALALVGRLGRVLKVLLLVPAFIRNPIYRWVARNRYRWFGRRDTCRLPSPEERAQFLP